MIHSSYYPSAAVSGSNTLIATSDAGKQRVYTVRQVGVRWVSESDDGFFSQHASEDDAIQAAKRDAEVKLEGAALQRRA